MADVPLRVLVAADDPIGRSGLAALLQREERLAVVGQTGTSALVATVETAGPSVVLWDAGSGPAAVVLPDGGVPTLALVSDADQARNAVARGARGVLARDGDGPRIALALQAMWDGMVVLDEPFAAVLLPEPRTSASEGLTRREDEVLALLAEGLSNKEIAAQLGISDHTAKFHVKAILDKLGAATRTEAVVRAARQGRLLL